MKKIEGLWKIIKSLRDGIISNFKKNEAEDKKKNILSVPSTQVNQ